MIYQIKNNDTQLFNTIIRYNHIKTRNCLHNTSQ